MTLTTPRSRRFTGARAPRRRRARDECSDRDGRVDPGTPDKDVHIGKDNDNASNPFIQPPGVAAPQHMNDTDLLFGRGNADLLVGNKGNDVAARRSRPGHPRRTARPRRRLGQRRHGGRRRRRRRDLVAGGRQRHRRRQRRHRHPDRRSGPHQQRRAPARHLDLNRAIPKVDIAGPPEPDLRAGPGPRLGAPRRAVPARVSTAAGALANTLRVKDMEAVVCPGPYAGTARVADLTAGRPSFSTVPRVGCPRPGRRDRRAAAVTTRIPDPRTSPPGGPHDRNRRPRRSSSARASPACWPRGP